MENRNTSQWNGEQKYEVQDPFYGQVVVDMEAKTCTCRRWDLTGIPCMHACSAIADNRGRAELWVSDCYLKDSYMRSYSHMLQPLNGMKMWPSDNRIPVRPPMVRKMPGRPKKSRRKKVGEAPKQTKTTRAHTQVAVEENVAQMVSKKGGTIKCSVCKQQGHNKLRCPQNAGAPKQPRKPRKRKNQGEGGRSTTAADQGTRNVDSDQRSTVVRNPSQSSQVIANAS